MRLERPGSEGAWISSFPVKFERVGADEEPLRFEPSNVCVALRGCDRREGNGTTSEQTLPDDGMMGEFIIKSANLDDRNERHEHNRQNTTRYREKRTSIP